MQFGFYPGHERGCGHPRDCPQLGGASAGHLVQIVKTHEDSRLHVHRQLDAERERNSELVAKVLRLEKALEQARFELRFERKNKFATNDQKSESDDSENCNNAAQASPLVNAVRRLGTLAGTVRHQLNTMFESMCQHRPAAHTARRTTWRSTTIRRRPSTCGKTLSMADITSRYSLIRRRGAVTVVAGVSKREQARSSLVELALTFDPWQSICETRLASRIEKSHVRLKICWA